MNIAIFLKLVDCDRGFESTTDYQINNFLLASLISTEFIQYTTEASYTSYTSLEAIQFGIF